MTKLVKLTKGITFLVEVLIGIETLDWTLEEEGELVGEEVEGLLSDICEGKGEE